jgi:hypothetical protein
LSAPPLRRLAAAAAQDRHKEALHLRRDFDRGFELMPFSVKI